MIKKTLLITLLLACLAPWAVGQTYQIGTGTSGNSTFPAASQKRQSLTQQIFTTANFASAVNVNDNSAYDCENGGTITKLYFYNAQTKDREMNIDIYMSNTSKSSFNIGDSWIAPSEFTLVYSSSTSGNITFTKSAWTGVTLTTPFLYNGTDNLAIMVVTYDWDKDLQLSFYGTSVTGESFCYSDNTTTHIDITNISNYTGSRGYSKNTIRFDITPAAVSCPKPNDFTAVINGGSSITAGLSWTAGNEEAEWDVAYSDDNTVDPETIAETVTGTSYTTGALTENVTYYAWVRANCSESEHSGWRGPISFYPGYCTPGTSSRDGKGITGVEFGTNNITVNNSNSNGLPSSTPYFGNYTNMVGAVEAGVASTIAITTSTGSYPYTFVIWVDYNKNLTFEDSEIVYTGKCSSGSGTLDASITVPMAQATGDYRMRIAGADSYFNSFYNSGNGLNYNAAHDPCLTTSGTYIVFNDYTLRVITANSCTHVPSNFDFEESYTSATATWEATEGESCDIYWSTSNNNAPDANTTPSQAGITSETTNYSYNIPSLTANNTYYVWVRVNCSANEHGNWTSAGNFSTLNYDAPTTLTFSEIAHNAARASWTAPHNDVNYTYQYKAANGSWTDEATTSNTFVNLSGLSALTSYTFKVKANYPGNVSSEYAEGNFTTTSQYPTPTGLAASGVKTSAATLNWNSTTGATSYNLRYRKISEGTQVGTDITTTLDYQQYTFDLSSFSGNGRIAIRHYNCNDQYYLAVDDVVVTNSNDVTVLSEDFEGSDMPTGWVAIDKDGDGYNWAQYSPSGYAHESDGVVYSESYHGSTKLYPDNLLISPEVELGGQVTLWARGVNSYGYEEVFGIYVIQSEWTTETGISTTTVELSNLTGSTGYEAQIQAIYSGGTSAWSDVCNFITLPVIRYTSTASYQSWASESAWTPNVIPTANHDVVIEQAAKISAENAVANNITINSGASLNIQNTRILTCNNITNNGNLVIADGGQLICSNNPTVTVNKTTAAWNDTDKGWYAISSPVNNVTVESVAQGTYNMYYYNEPDNMWMNDKVTENEVVVTAFENLTNGRGYLYRSTQANTSFTGNANVGPVVVNMSRLNPDYNYLGFNLIGNPYTHNIYKGVAIPNTTLESQYCVLNADGTWTVTNDNVAIAPAQAVLVQATSSGNIEIAKNPNSSAKSGNDNIWFTVKNAEFTDVACVEFKEGHGLNKPEHHNAKAPMFYIVNNGERFASADMSDDTRVINLGFEAKTMSQYSISLKAQGNFSYMHLYDKLTGEDVDMLIEDSYSFIGTPNDRKDRFVLRLTYNASIEEVEANTVFVYQSGSDIIVNGEGELQVFDMMGRKVMTQHINGVETINMNANGVFIFKMNDKVQKIVVR